MPGLVELLLGFRYYVAVGGMLGRAMRSLSALFTSPGFFGPYQFWALILALAITIAVDFDATLGADGD